MNESIKPGTLLGGRYEIIEKIGAGGMAMVYKAHCRLLNRYVAVKVLRPEFREDAEFIKKFNIEAQAAASLSHPNIVSIYDVGREGEWHYIVMELVEGVTLKQYIERKGTLPWQQAAGFAAQLCSALECAHKNHIIHHDIKPHNMIITADDMLKVTDFGIARAATSSTLVAGGSTMGSVHYFSPEQARGGYTDEKSDIYSAGIVMYEMLTGRVPFNSESAVTVALMHMQNEPRPLRELNDAIPESIENIVLKAIRKEQHLRYQTAGEMLAELNAVLARGKAGYDDCEEADQTKPVPAILANKYGKAGKPGGQKKAGKRPKEPLTKHEKIATWVAVVVAMLLLGAMGWFVLSSLGLVSFGRNEIEVPNFVDMEINDAKQGAKDQKLTLEIDEEIESATVEKGHIISQDPAAGRLVKPHAKIKVKVSSGAGLVKVASVVNMEQRSAVNELESLGLVAVVALEESETIPEGVVVRQVPEAGVEVSAGSVVKLYVSGRQAEQIKIPDVTGETLTRARVSIESAGLTMGNVSEVTSEKTVGTVISQSPRSGSYVAKKTPIDLTVSKGVQTQPPVATATPEPAAKVKTLSIPVPQDKDSTRIKVVANGKSIHDAAHNKSEGAFDLKVSGHDTVSLEIYHDGSLKSTQTINFN